jgi:hypothetical protein
LDAVEAYGKRAGRVQHLRMALQLFYSYH